MLGRGPVRTTIAGTANVPYVPYMVLKRPYDVALSFAGEDRDHARSLADELTRIGVRVFYDEYERAELWGKNLYTHLSDVYQNQATYMVAFFSQHYAQRLWTKQELQAAQSRAFAEHDDYILAVRIDDTPIPGFLPTIGYVRISEMGSAGLAQLIIGKLGIRINEVDDAELVRVTEGDFVMGSDTEADQSPAKLVHLSTYYIYKYPVTIEQYRSFTRATGHREPAHGGANYADDYPIVNVSWYDAESYCAWAQARLPTEAEWEKAARGTDARIFPWGDRWNSAACEWHRYEYGDAGSPVPVSAHPLGVSPFEVFDMVGNIDEWCADWYDPEYYTRAPSEDPPGPGSGKERVTRGCHWADDVRFPANFSCSFRRSHAPGFTYRTLWASAAWPSSQRYPHLIDALYVEYRGRLTNWTWVVADHSWPAILGTGATSRDVSAGRAPLQRASRS